MDIQKTETLKIIRFLESSDGKFTNHKSSARGDYGIMPKFLADAKKEFHYKNVKLTDTQKASLGYDFIVKKIGTNNPYHVAYAWNNGVYKIRPFPFRREDVLNHWYVRKFKSRALASSSVLQTSPYLDNLRCLELRNFPNLTRLGLR